MIQSIMLVLLGILSALMLGLIVAPSFLQRAVRLNTKKLQAHLPSSLADFEAQKDQLRADYAIRIRRLEVSLDLAKEKAAKLLVDLNKDEMKIQELEAGNNELRASLAEKNSRSIVLEQTVRTEIPNLKNELVKVKAELNDKENLLGAAKESIETQSNKLSHAARTEQIRQSEIGRLRDAIRKEKNTKPVEDAGDNQKLVITAQILQDELEKARQFQDVEAPILKDHMRELGGKIFELIELENRHSVTNSARPEAETPTSQAATASTVISATEKQIEAAFDPRLEAPDESRVIESQPVAAQPVHSEIKREPKVSQPNLNQPVIVGNETVIIETADDFQQDDEHRFDENEIPSSIAHSDGLDNILTRPQGNKPDNSGTGGFGREEITGLKDTKSESESSLASRLKGIMSGNR